MDPPPPQTSGKLRLMCSYGGHIVPMPFKKSLYYSGGDTRIISVPTSSTATVSAFLAHIAATLRVSYPFTLKYQLPLHDLDSLISLSTDDDLQIFLEEFQRLSDFPEPTRIRLFLFGLKQSELKTTQCGLTHPKTESWFVDALKGAKMMQKGEIGFGGEGQIQSEGSNGNGSSGGLCGQESMVLETTSSYGSTSSSVSLSNLPPIKACGDESLTFFQDNRAKLPSAESTASDINSPGSAISYAQTGTYQDHIVPIASMENKVSFNAFESWDTKIREPVSEMPSHKTVQAYAYPLSSQLDQLQGQQMQFVQMGSHYVSQNPTTVVPVASYYPVHNTLSHQQQQLQYLPNQSYPVYVVLAGETPKYESSVQYGSKETLSVVSGRPPLHPNSTLISPQVAYKDVTATPPVPEFVSPVYRTTQVGNAPIHANCNENKQQNVVVSQTHNQPQLIDLASGETANYCDEYDDDPARSQIYKTQPLPPSLPPQYQTMKASALLLSEALSQLHLDNVNQ
ncbi:uncharacterized protein LOC116111226 [Pistacia vera]|uniref:uncharacterized protein LOC116111226 n=1 Tax=Pistacia vera TaxID=55513 RepID=UPI001262E87D|nr:uncharacterized protein LOC116111226 [Pistacia vera]